MNRTAKQEVTAYCKQIGLKVSGKGGIPMLSNKSSSWVDCFDTWEQARSFLRSARINRMDSGQAFPWEVA